MHCANRVQKWQSLPLLKAKEVGDELDDGAPRNIELPKGDIRANSHEVLVEHLAGEQNGVELVSLSASFEKIAQRSSST
jgi:hypothetical protein